MKPAQKVSKTLDYTTEIFSAEEEFALTIIALFVGISLFIAFLVEVYIPFKETRDYIKREMKRSLNKEEYKFWKGELRQLYLSSIPLVGRFFR